MKQKTALDILKLGHNVFLTGPAGSGKTFLLRQYIDYLKKNGIGVAVTASTGIAATHMDGQTIHSWSGMGISDSFTEAEYAKLKKRHYHSQRLRSTKVLIIDEISMLHAHQLDIVNAICKRFKEPFSPFGGLQVILCGDFYQLPPVTQSERQAQFVTQSESWGEMDLKICYLEEQHRQEDKQMLKILSDIRNMSCDSKTVDLIYSREHKKIKNEITPTRLYTHNANVDYINDLELKKINEEVHVFQMTESGNEHVASSIKKGCLAPEKLALKKGAVVMFVKNNFDQGYVNGTLGKVIDFDGKGMPIVKTVSGKTIVASPEKWLIAENEKTLASISQVPLRLAWAITIHKSQGMTLDAVEMDLSKSFEYGMGYVALSRVRTLDGIKLLGINDMALEVNPNVHKFDKVMEKMSHENVSKFSKIEAVKKKKMQKEFLERCKI